MGDNEDFKKRMKAYNETKEKLWKKNTERELDDLEKIIRQCNLDESDKDDDIER